MTPTYREGNAVADNSQRQEATLAIQLGYKGTDFSGFAAQEGQRTVASELTRALETFFHRPVEITCAGRTDAGVHAIAQMVSLPVFDEEIDTSRHRLFEALHALVPDDISIKDLFYADKGFSARFDALERDYVYRIYQGSSRSVVLGDFSWNYRSQLDQKSMQEAAQYLIGEHDFKSFCKAASAVGKPTCRNIFKISVQKEFVAAEPYLLVRVAGSSFLHSMVRTLVGTLVEVGRGKRRPSWVQEVLFACDRQKAGMCAPAKGLVFERVVYPEGLLSFW